MNDTSPQQNKAFGNAYSPLFKQAAEVVVSLDEMVDKLSKTSEYETAKRKQEKILQHR